LHESDRAVEVLGGFAGEADDEVARELDAGDLGAERVDDLEVALDGIAPAHGLEDRVRSRLRGEVQVLADLGEVAHRVDQAGPYERRVRGDEADAADAVHLADLAEQTAEIAIRLEPLAVAVDGLAEEGDFDGALSGEP